MVETVAGLWSAAHQGYGVREKRAMIFA